MVAVYISGGIDHSYAPFPYSKKKILKVHRYQNDMFAECGKLKHGWCSPFCLAANKY
jgi:hypothetical protein